MNSSKKIDVSNYSYKELKKCIRPFTEYKEDHGSTQPVNTGYSFIDNLGNWSVSCLGIKTNQKYVSQILEILNHVEKEYEQKSWVTEPLAVALTLEKLKKIYDQMLTAGIKNGKTIDGLSILFGHFNFPYQETGTKYDEMLRGICHEARDLNSVTDNNESEVIISQSSLSKSTC